MRSKWVDMMRNDKVSLTEAVKKCRVEWASLFTDLHEATVEKSKQNEGASVKESPQKRPRRDLPRVEETRSGVKICTFYNEGKCNYGRKCKFAHVCNVRGCGADHTAYDNHKLTN